jgi:UDP-2,3-diacylglucosamine hydrolase
MALLVISDLHILGPHDPLYASLLKLIRERASSGDTLVLAGDVFDLFVGNKNIFLERYSAFVEALEDAGRRGVQIHYIEGNHDFLIRGAFGAIPGVRVHNEDVSLDLGGRRFFISHGDTFDRADYGYRALRIFYRSALMKGIVQVVPGRWLDWYGKAHSKQSRASKPILASGLPIERRERLRKVYRSAAAELLAEGYDFVVAGHCHDLDEMEFTIAGRWGQYVNVGYPRAHGSYLSWSPGEPKIQREKLP